jgi:hypothetical protein
MTLRSRDQSFPNDPGFDPGSSSILSVSNTMVPRSTLSPQIRIENPALGATPQMEKQQSLSSPPSAKGLRSRRMLEDLAAENSRLRIELKAVQSRQADVIDRMVTDLVKAKSELQAKDVGLSNQQSTIEKQNTELEHLRHNVSNISAELQNTRLAQSDTQNSAELQLAISQLTTEMREKDLHLREKDQILREREFELRAVSGQLEQEQRERRREVVEMQQLQNLINEQGQRTMDNSQLEMERSRAEALQQQVREYLEQLSQFKASQGAAQSAIDAERAKSQQYLQEIDQRKIVHQQQQSQIAAQEARIKEVTKDLNNLQASFQRTVDETKDISQTQAQREASHANELAEARRMAKFFKKNSEATTRKVKGLEAEVVSLEQSLHRNRGVQKQDGTSTADAALQGGNFSAPGAWPDRGMNMDIQRNSPSFRRKPMASSMS